jgi:hypothetical protein
MLTVEIAKTLAVGSARLVEFSSEFVAMARVEFQSFAPKGNRV